MIPDSYRACGEQPSNDGPAGDDVRTEDLVGGMNDGTDVTD